MKEFSYKEFKILNDHDLNDLKESDYITSIDCILSNAMDIIIDTNAKYKRIFIFIVEKVNQNNINYTEDVLYLLNFFNNKEMITDFRQFWLKKIDEKIIRLEHLKSNNFIEFLLDSAENMANVVIESNKNKLYQATNRQSIELDLSELDLCKETLSQFHYDIVIDIVLSLIYDDDFYYQESGCC